MELILDTNALSALADGDPALRPILRQASKLSVPVIVLGEYRYGVRQSHLRFRYERWLEQATTRLRVLSLEEATADSYAEIRDELKRSGRPIPAYDLWIAALVRQYGLALVSRDRHFDWVSGLKRLDW